MAILLGLTASVGSAHTPASTPSPKLAKGVIVFPLVGKVEYGNSYGDARANGAHAGIDIEAAKRAPVLAAEAGTVKFWTTSARAGCMLYLYGASGTTYLYIHLNNDLTPRNDNRGACVPGVAYADGLRNGGRVEAGEMIAYNGDSGDADGNPHLHFEVHPKDGPDVNPFPYLNRATRLLFPGRAGSQFTVGLRGTLVAAGQGHLELKARSVRWWPGGRWTALDERVVVVEAPQETEMDKAIVDAVESPFRRELSSRRAARVTVYTAPAALTVEAQRGDPGALVAARVVSR